MNKYCLCDFFNGLFLMYYFQLQIISMKFRFYLICINVNKFFFRNDLKVFEVLFGMKKCEEFCCDFKIGGVKVNSIEDYLKGKLKQIDIKIKVFIDNYMY